MYNILLYCAISMATGHVVPYEGGRHSIGSITAQHHDQCPPLQQTAIFSQSESTTSTCVHLTNEANYAIYEAAEAHCSELITITKWWATTQLLIILTSRTFQPRGLWQLVSSWQISLGRKVLLVSIINSCVVACQFGIGVQFIHLYLCTT